MNVQYGNYQPEDEQDEGCPKGPHEHYEGRVRIILTQAGTHAGESRAPLCRNALRAGHGRADRVRGLPGWALAALQDLQYGGYRAHHAGDRPDEGYKPG